MCSGQKNTACPRTVKQWHKNPNDGLLYFTDDMSVVVFVNCECFVT